MSSESYPNDNDYSWYSLPVVLPDDLSSSSENNKKTYSSHTNTLGFAWIPDIHQFIPNATSASSSSADTDPHPSLSSSPASLSSSINASRRTLFWHRIRHPMVVQGKVVGGNEHRGWRVAVDHVYDWSPDAELISLPRLSHLSEKGVDGVDGMIRPGEVSEDVGMTTRDIDNRRKENIPFSVGDTVIALVVTCDAKTHKLNLSLNNNRLRLLSDRHYNAVRLGRGDFRFSSLPPPEEEDAYDEEEKETEEGIKLEDNCCEQQISESYNTHLFRDESFHNPYATEQMLAALDLDASGSLLPQPNGGKCPESETHNSIEKMQSRILSEETLRVGVDYARQGHTEDALRAYNKALEYNANNTDARVARGAALANKGEYEDAKKEFTKALKLDPQHPTAGRYLKATEGKMRELKKKKEQDPTDFSRLIAAARAKSSSSKADRDEDDSSFSDSSSSSSYSRRQKKKHKKKRRHHHRKDKKRRRKKRHDDDDERREKKKRRKDKKEMN